MNKMNITSSEPEFNLERSGKGLITSLVIKTILRSNKNKIERYVISNASMKDLSKIIKEFEKLPFNGYAQKSTKHEPTDS